MIKPQKGEIRKPTKTISGITPVAVMLPPRACEHGNCIYCPSMNVPQSYTPRSPVVMRASKVNYDSYKQVRRRLQAFEIMNHPTDKIEIIIMGGTFLEYEKEFQNKFIKGIYDGLNAKKSKTLEQAQKLNESVKCRCVAMCVETRPDVCVEFIDMMRSWGVTRVELGVQIIDDKIYEKVNRGHSVQDVIETTRELKNEGFKVGYHIMPGLPGSDLKKDLKLFKKIFSDSNFRPDQLKIYPCQVMPSSELEKIYWKGNYKPYTKKEIEKLLLQIMKVVPRYCRVMRVMREIPPEYIVAGTTRIDLRREVEKKLRNKKIKLKEIRYREIGFVKKISGKLKLKITKYKASKGTEYFLEIVDRGDILFGLLRLRIFDKKNGADARLVGFAPEQVQGASQRKFINRQKKFESEKLGKRGEEGVGKTAIIRELHVYGPALKLGEQGKLGQHRGFGKELMEKAEKIAKKNNCKKISIISGIGVREYYKKLGYGLEGTYMVKFL